MIDNTACDCHWASVCECPEENDFTVVDRVADGSVVYSSNSALLVFHDAIDWRRDRT